VITGLASFAAQASPLDGQTVACGPKDEQSWLCSTVYKITDNRSAAELADKFAKPLHILVILLVAYITVRVLRWLIRRTVQRMQTDAESGRIDKLRRATGLSLLDSGAIPNARRMQRAETIGTLLRSVASLLVWATAVLTILNLLGVNVAPIIAGAGVVGIAIGFGAQALVRDFISGLFMLIENQFGVGDTIDAGPATGVVESVTLRSTKLRDIDGVVWHIPNGEIKRVGNKSQQWARAVLDVTVSYDTDVESAIAVIKRVADELWHDSHYRAVIVGEPDVLGIEAVGDDRVVIRTVVKTRPLEQAPVTRALRARVRTALADAQISVPGPAAVPAPAASDATPTNPPDPGA